MTREEVLKIAKPILFNTEMVQAISRIENAKTATRRLIKLKGYDILKAEESFSEFWFHVVKSGCEITAKTSTVKPIRPPYQVGDVLYVRETWCIQYCWECEQNGYSDDCEIESANFDFSIAPFGEHGCYIYYAENDTYKPMHGWKPSIHMPKEAARIFLRVTDVRVERLQDMTVDDCLKEGVTASPPPICRDEISFPKGFEHLTEEKQKNWIESAARARYIGWCDFADKLFRAMTLVWNSTVKKSDREKYGWAADPWVWVIEFERLEVET